MPSIKPKFQVVVSEAEKVIIESKAKLTGKSVSSFLKDLALSYDQITQPVTQPDLKVTQLEQQVIIMQAQISDINQKLCNLPNLLPNLERESIGVQLLSKKLGMPQDILRQWAKDAYQSSEEMLSVGWNLANRDKQGEPWYPMSTSGGIWQRTNPTPEHEEVTQPIQPVTYSEETESTLDNLEVPQVSLETSQEPLVLTRAELAQRFTKTPKEAQTLAATLSTLGGAKMKMKTIADWTAKKDPEGLTWEPIDETREYWRQVNPVD
ncbi:plasmid mobilization protein [Nostoc sp.]|uniref:plasmid mobilization protein n=1 Tax=Nostoc sp. TaxID=1180 RepID=UPI002FFBF067